MKLLRSTHSTHRSKDQGSLRASASNASVWLLVLGFFLFTGMRVAPYFFSHIPTGYDAGLYLYLLKQYNQVPLLSYYSLSGWVISQFPIGIAVIGRVLTGVIPPEALIFPLIVGFSIPLFIAVFVLVRSLWGKREAVWAAFFLGISAIQFHAYWYYYAKQIFASSLLLFTFYFFFRCSFWAIPLAIYISYTHEPTFIVLVLAMTAGFIFEKSKRRYYAVVGMVTAVFSALYYLPNYTRTIEQYVAPAVSSLIPPQAGGSMFRPSGTFYDLLPAFLLTLPYLPFALIGITRLWNVKRTAPMLGALVGSLVIAIFGLFLSRRFIIFADLFIILYAGYGMVYVIEKYKKVRMARLLLAGYALALLLFICVYVYKTGSPPIVEDELHEISLLRETEPDSYVLVTDNEYMPWVYGWSDRKTIAPGYGQYDTYWTRAQWHTFWESGDRKTEHDLLLKLPKPLYIFAGDHQRQYVFDLSGPCFTRINWRTYKFVCEK